MAATAAQSAPASTPAPTTIPMQNLAGLEEQLRSITGKIDSLRQHDVEHAIAALREELTEIGHSLNEALPRHSLEIIEWRIHDLTQRIADGKMAGADTDALARVEHGLGEVRDTLHALTPAESLVGFNDAVVDIARRIDLVVAQRDPETFAQLESAITTLRAVANHIASNETVGRLAAEVQTLGDKIEHFAQATADGGTFNNLESSITSLSDALAERSQSGTVSPRIEPLLEQLVDKVEQIQDSRHGNTATLANIENRLATLAAELATPAQGDGGLAARFEGLLEQLSGKIEEIHLSRDSNRASFGQLEERISHLVQRLDGSDSRLGGLEAVERALADLLSHVEEIRASTGTLHAERMQGAYDLKADIARTQDAIDGLHAALGVVVDRLGAIEQSAQGRPSPEIDASFGELRRAIDKLAEQSFAASPAAPVVVAAAASPPIDPDLPPDQPLEPGSGGPRVANVAVSVEAPRIEPGERPSPAGTPGSKSSFIAAARRAAQAAGEENNGRTARAKKPGAKSEGSNTESKSIVIRMLGRLKSLLVAASVVAIVLGAAQIVGQMLERGDPSIPSRKAASISDNDGNSTAKPEAALADAQSQPPLSPAPGKAQQDITASANETLFSPPMLGGGKDDVTGSISHAASKAAASAKQPSGGLPEAIGGVRLRSAATAGDAAAAYEIAARFAEGHGVPANQEEAAQWYARAAAKGLPMAQFRYASMLEKGRGVKKDLTHARRLYLAAANKGNAKAMHNLAVLYAEGIDGKPDYNGASNWFRKAADAGISDSQFNLGVLYARGLGVEKDLAESYKWFALAAARGDRDAGKKRDNIAAEIDAKTLAAAKQAVDSFVAKPEPAEATTVPSPAGGWDNASGAPPAKAGLQLPAALSTGAFTVGKR
jgi:localization factor PodJL